VRAAFSKASASSVFRSIDGVSYWTVVNAVRPFAEIAPPSASGSGTAVTPGSLRSAASERSTPAFGPASVSLPWSIVKTTWL
jgi:hypothetical protein